MNMVKNDISDELLQKCKDNFEEAPRRISILDKFSYLTFPKPWWLKFNSDDDLNLLFQNIQELLTNGVVVWGSIIQVNSQLYEDGKENCPGEVVYSLPASTKIDTDNLSKVSDELYSLKGTCPTNNELNSIADYLTDETIRVYGLPVPSCLSPETKCFISTTFFHRKHLPQNKITSSLLPIIVNPRTPHVAIPLPERYWPQELKKSWKGSGRSRSKTKKKNQSFLIKILLLLIMPFCLFLLKKFTKPYVNQQIAIQSCVRHFSEHQLLLDIKSRQKPELKLPTTLDTKSALNQIFSQKQTAWLNSYDAACPRAFKKNKNIGYLYVGGNLTLKEIVEKKALVLFCSADDHKLDESSNAYLGSSKNGEYTKTNSEMISILKRALIQYKNKEVNYTKASIDVIKSELDKRLKHSD